MLQFLQELDVLLREPCLVERDATRSLDRAAQGGSPDVLDERDSSRGTDRHRLGQRPGGGLYDLRKVGVSVVETRCLGSTQKRHRQLTEVRGHTSGGCQGLESVVIDPRDEQQVYESDNSGLAKPSELSEDLPGEHRLVETEDQNLDWA